MESQGDSISIEKGQVLGDIVCARYQVANDIVLVWDKEGNARCYLTNSLKKKPVLYTIDGAEILFALVPSGHELLVLETKDKVYYRDSHNKELEGSEKWKDYYYEPINQQFYRKDKAGNWYNLEGNKMDKPVFLQDNVLVSLMGKVSMRSLVFRKEELVCSPNFELVQIGKLVYDKHLQLINYLGERITEIGKCNVQFSAGDNLQEVRIGVNKVGFINEQTQEVCQIHGNEIKEYAGKVELFDKHNFKVFKSDEKVFFLEDSSTSVFCIDDIPASLIPDSYMKFGTFELVGVKDPSNDYFVDINTKQIFRIPEIENDLIQEVENDPVIIGTDSVYNIKTNKRSITYCLNDNCIFSIENASVIPERIEVVAGFESYYFIAVVKGVRKLCYAKNRSIIKLGEQNLEISMIEGENNQLLLNVVGVNGEHFVMDGRNGYDKVSLAICDGKRIVKVKDDTVKISNLVLQKVELLNIGGSEDAIINLNVQDLELFRLPQDMFAYPEQEELSIFSGNIVKDVDFTEHIEIGEHGFYQATFLNYLGQKSPVMISSDTGRPLQLLGKGHRLELVKNFDEATIQTAYYLGINRMVGSFTLSEDVKERELLFSVDSMSSWIPFYDTHLPIFGKIIEISGLEDWEYILFESREGTNEKEYVAVEKIPPYRVLVEKKSGKQQVKIIKGEEIKLKAPERVSRIKQLFYEDPGYLVELD